MHLGPAIEDHENLDPFSAQRPTRQPPRVQLRGLREVDWESTPHAYGVQPAIPDLIDALSSRDPEDRSWGLETLRACVLHQGLVCPATASVVPFLVQLSEFPLLEVAADLLCLLCEIAVEYPTRNLVGREGEGRSGLHDLVVSGVPSYQRLLAASDARVRTAAAYLLAHCHAATETSLVALRSALLVEGNRLARASQLIALGYVSRFLNDQSARAGLCELLTHECKLIQASSALALQQMLGRDAPQEAGQVLERLGDELLPIVGFFPFADGDLAHFARVSRITFMPQLGLWDCLERPYTDHHQSRLQDSEIVAQRLLTELFVDGLHGPQHPWWFGELAEPHRRLLHFLIWLSSGEEELPFGPMLIGAGLYEEVAWTKRLLGYELGGLDETLTLRGSLRPLWVWCRQALLEPDIRTELVEAVLAMTVAKRVAIVEDWLTGAYELVRPRREWLGAVLGDSLERNPFTDGLANMNRFASEALILAADLVGRCAEAAAWARTALRQRAGSRTPLVAERLLIGALVLSASSKEPRDAALVRTSLEGCRPTFQIATEEVERRLRSCQY